MVTADMTSRAARAGKFGVVGAVGLGVNVAAQIFFADILGLNYLVAAALATQVSSTANYVMAEQWVFGGADISGRRWMRFAAFVGMNNVALVLRAPLMWLLTSQMGMHFALSNLLSIALMTLVRFGVADGLIWRDRQPVLATVAPTAMSPPGEVLVLRRQRLRELVDVRVALATVASVGAVFRLINLTAVGLNSDEAVYAGQGAAMFGVGSAPEHFSLFRAHPLMLQAVVGVTFKALGQSDYVARLVVATVFGVGSVLVAYLLARAVVGPRAGLVSAALCAVLPYHVIVSRQVLVDTAMGFFAALSLYLVVRWLNTSSRRAYAGASVVAGLATLSKEIAVLLVPVLLYATWQGGGWSALKGRLARWCLGVYVVLVLPFPLTRLVSQSKNASSFVLWQFSRAPNHERWWFGRVLVQYVTPPVLVLVVVGAAVLIRRRNPADRVVLCYLGLFATFFTVWPTKLFPYLYLLVPALTLLAAAGLIATVRRLASIRWLPLRPTAVATTLVAGMLLFLGAFSVRAVAVTSQKDVPGIADFDVEVQSFAGTREFAEWARSTPTNSRFLTIGPSLGNILRFYGDRDSVAMSVSIDPLKRNPAYVPVPNPDLSLREMHVQYVVWDTYSADRSSFYSARTLSYARKFGGVIVFSAYADSHGGLVVAHGPPPQHVRALLTVYSVHGGPLPGEGADE